MEPIAQTIEVAADLSHQTGQDDVLPALQEVADEVERVVPDCVGLSLAWNEHGVTFTMVASDEQIAVLDALQYLDGGPCVRAIDLRHGLPTDHDSLMSESGWQLFAMTTAAHGVRSTLTMPLTHAGRTMGSVNLYGASDHAFEGHHEELAEILGAYAPGAVRNADLGFTTLQTAESAPQSLRDQGALNRAIGIVAAHQDIDVVAASERLRQAADRAGVTPVQLAVALLQMEG